MSGTLEGKGQTVSVFSTAVSQCLLHIGAQQICVELNLCVIHRYLMCKALFLAHWESPALR